MTTIYDYRTICDGPGCNKVQPKNPYEDALAGWYNLTFHTPPSPNPDEERHWWDSEDRDFCCFECLEAWCAKRREEAR